MEQHTIIKKVKIAVALGRRCRQIRYKIDNYFYSRNWLIFPRLRHFAKLKNSQKGKRVFLIGNGPSLKKEDLDLLKNEICIAANKIYLVHDQTEWRPKYYLIQDDLIIEHNRKEIENAIKCPIFSPIRFEYQKKIKNSCYFYLHYELNRNGGRMDFGDDAIRGFYDCSTVMYTMMQFASFLGFSEAYLLGVDYNYQPTMKDNGNASSHFVENYRKPGEVMNTPDLESSYLGYAKAAEVANSGGMKIYNCTRGGKLDLFPRVLLEDALGLKLTK